MIARLTNLGLNKRNTSYINNNEISYFITFVIFLEYSRSREDATAVFKVIESKNYETEFRLCCMYRIKQMDLQQCTGRVCMDTSK